MPLVFAPLDKAPLSAGYLVRRGN